MTAPLHEHIYLAPDHSENERRTWLVIGLCSAMMAVEIAGGYLLGSVALIADGLHMFTHAAAFLIAALAYTYARRHAQDARFSFGTGKLGDLAGFSSAIVLAMIAVLIAVESIGRFFHPVPIVYGEAMAIAALGLAVNVASAWLLGAGHHHGPGGHGHDHGHSHAAHSHDAHGYDDHGHDDHGHDDHGHDHHDHDHPHDHEHDHGHAHAQPAAMAKQIHRDNNMRAALVHVIADAAVSVLVLAGLAAGHVFGWWWTDPAVGLVGAAVIANWAYGLMRDTGAILLDMTPDRALAGRLRGIVEARGDAVADLHLWRVGPGHLAAIVSVRAMAAATDVATYRRLLHAEPGLSHVTVEVLAGE